jgi:SAM-dependent methyltransferase
VLEIGPGIGSDAAEFARAGADYYAIDYSEESVKLAQQRFQVEGLEGEFRCGDASDPSSYKDLPAMDLVYSYGVIHHFPAIGNITKNVYNVLAPGGEFRFMVYAKNSWKQAMINKGLDQYEAQAGCPYAKSYTKDDIHELLEPNFEILRLRQDHCFMYNVEQYKQGNYELEPWFAAMPEAMREAVREYLGWHLLVKARKN